MKVIMAWKRFEHGSVPKYSISDIFSYPLVLIIKRLNFNVLQVTKTAKYAIFSIYLQANINQFSIVDTG